MTAHPVTRWLHPRPEGLYCAAGDFFIDPVRAVDRAVITHGHSDHARPGHARVLATAETLAVMAERLGPKHAGQTQALGYGEALTINDVTVTLVPAGHVLGSAQVALEHKGQCAVVSGDYKRASDPTCAPFEVHRCDLFVTEATFGLPVFRHEPADQEVQRLLASMQRNPDRAHLLGVYGLGKCQRLLALVRQAGYDKPIYMHGALRGVTGVYQRLGQDFGDLRAVTEATDKALAGELVLGPPSALADRWTRRFADPLPALASGWMRVRARARQRGAELPLIISDHADWPELLGTIKDTGADEIWVTHGREDALLHQIKTMGLQGQALSLVGYEEEDEAG